MEKGHYAVTVFAQGRCLGSHVLPGRREHDELASPGRYGQFSIESEEGNLTADFDIVEIPDAGNETLCRAAIVVVGVGLYAIAGSCTEAPNFKSLIVMLIDLLQTYATVTPVTLTMLGQATIKIIHVPVMLVHVDVSEVMYIVLEFGLLVFGRLEAINQCLTLRYGQCVVVDTNIVREVHVSVKILIFFHGSILI